MKIPDLGVLKQTTTKKTLLSPSIILLLLLGFFVYDCLSAIFYNICMERAWIRESSFDLEQWVRRYLGRVKFWVCGFGEL